MARGVWLAGRREQRLLQLFIVKIIELFFQWIAKLEDVEENQQDRSFILPDNNSCMRSSQILKSVRTGCG